MEDIISGRNALKSILNLKAKFKVYGLLLLLLPLPLLIASSTNSTYAGKVILVKGTAIAIDEKGKERKLKRRAQIFSGDTLKTVAKSSMRLVMVDQSVLSLKSDTILKISDYKFSFNEKKKDAMALDLLKGGMRAVTGIIGRRSTDNYKIKTRTAVMGVRGTAMEIILDPNGNVSVAFDFGSGYAINDAGRFDIGNLQTAQISDFGKPPRVYKSQPRKKWDPANVARTIAAMQTDAVLKFSEAIVDKMNLVDRVLLIGILDQAPGISTNHVLKLVEGLISKDPASAQTMLMTATAVNRTRAALLLQSAVLGGLPVADALKFVMNGLMYPLPSEIKAVMVEAVKAGITKEDAEKILKESAAAENCG